ncbi:hypothetical protein KUTeg_014491 [Tegillarca granosa]|uniref:Ig-like domain-containing protein n=1 Tax=Tegillarca granosa TaxID=220873 RepID=A0ABQ9ES17_TEGGR|nr:hypothetical protein KUTeg_014491 [Tegillarca granosa]
MQKLPNIRWYENGVKIKGENQNFYDIPNINRNKNKFRIACEGNNTAVGPKILDMPTTVGVDVGDKVTLTCRSEGNPPADIIWRRKGYLTKSPLTTSPSYTIDRITEDDIGIYTCTASVRTFNDDSRDVYVLFNSAPKIVSNAQQYAAEGSSGKLECKGRAVPYPETIEWTRNNEVITYEGSGKYFEKQEMSYDVITSTLTITNTVESDFGQYNCTIVNSRGNILPLSLILGAVIGGVATIFFIALACVVYHRYCKSSDADSYAETDSNTEIKKREKSDSPSDFTNKSTLMDQWRQDLNYHCGTDYEDLYGPKNQNGLPVHLYSDYTHTTSGDPVENKYENGFNTYGTSSFRSTSRTDFSPTYDNSEPYRLPPADISTTKLATNV